MITPEGLLCRTADGSEVLVPGKTIVCAVGQRANRPEVEKLRLCAPFVREIGDCIRPANITKAVYEGYAAKVQERVTRQIRDYAYDCAMEMAVLPGADRGKLDAELAAYKASCTRSTGKRADGSRRADSRTRRPTKRRNGT